MSDKIALCFIFAVLCSLIFAFAAENDTTVVPRKKSENRVPAAVARTTKKATSANKTSLKQPDSSPRQRKWVTQLFMEAADKFDMNANVSAECKRDFELYKKHLQNQTVWAVRSKYCIVIC